MKEVRNFRILEAATDRLSLKIGILKSIKSLENTCEGVFLVKLQAIALIFYENCTPSQIFFKDFGPQTELSYFTKQIILKTPFLRGSVQPAFTYSNSIELTTAIYKV